MGDESGDSDQEQTAVRRVLSENQRLKQRVFELEEKLRKIAPQGEGHSGSGSSVLKLIEHKDFQLQQFVARLEEKKEQLAEAVSTVRLYQDIFDNDAAAMVGVNRDARIILFNRSAAGILGEKVQSALHQPIDSVDFSAVDPDLPRRVREALSGRKPVSASAVVRNRRVDTSIVPVGSESEARGALIRIQVQPTK